MKRLFVVFLILFVLYDTYDCSQTIEEQYTFLTKEEKVRFLNSRIINESEVADDIVDTAVNEMLKLPDGVWTDFFRNHGEIRLTYDMPVSEEGEVVGSFTVRNATYCEILIHPDYVEYSLLHEAGHYIYYINRVARDEQYKTCLPERSSTIDGVLSGEVYFSSEKEYFAEMTKLYFQGELKEEDAPYFYRYIKQLVSS